VNQNEIKYGTVQSSQPSQFFERSNIPLYQKMWSHMQSADTLVVGCLQCTVVSIGVRDGGAGGAAAPPKRLESRKVGQMFK
jgi:hypothetical protein